MEVEMTVEEAIERVRRYDAHQWVYEIAVSDGRGDSDYEDDRIATRSAYDRATIIVGGTDWRLALGNARQTGYFGPAFRVLENGNIESCGTAILQEAI
jgi:hypothetical protein